MSEKKMNTHSMDKLTVGTERKPSWSLVSWKSLDHNQIIKSSSKMLPDSYSLEVGRGDMSGSQYESNLFSSSLSELSSMKLRLSANNDVYSHSVDTTASLMVEEEPLESSKEIEAQIIGNILPSDEDLFTGVTDWKGPLDLDDVELDLFSNVGGIELGDDGSGSLNNCQFHRTTDHHPKLSNSLLGEHLSRTLFVRNINTNMEDSELKALFEQYGDVHTLYTASKHSDFVMVSYFDIRATRNAMQSLQNKPMGHTKLDIHYSIPKDNLSSDFSQGIVSIFDLDASVSNDDLQQIFGVYGDIKKIHENPLGSNNRFIEYYDIRSTIAAFQAINKKDIGVKQIKFKLGHLGALRRLSHNFPPLLEKKEHGFYLQHSGSPNNLTTRFPAVPRGQTIESNIDNGSNLRVSSSMQIPILECTYHHEVSTSIPTGSLSILEHESTIKQVGLAEPGHLQSFQFNLLGTKNGHPHSLPEYYDGIGGSFPHFDTMALEINQKPQERINMRQLYRGSTNGNSMVFGNGICISTINESSSLPSHQYAWNNFVHCEHANLPWLNSSPLDNGVSTTHTRAPVPGSIRPPCHQIMNMVLPASNHHVGSAPTMSPSFWDGLHPFVAESTEVTSFHPSSIGSTTRCNKSLHPMELFSTTIFQGVPRNCVRYKSTTIPSHHKSTFPTRTEFIPTTNSFETANERARSRRNEGFLNQADKRHYELDVNRILRGEDNRTTLMIKNIPNKYTSKMLLAAIDERHKGTYDFIYLPIDFKNKCNVGYAFINMIEPKHIIPFYQSFNGKKWEKFNSEKVATLAYARIQGKSALIVHFQNSSLMNEDKGCRPILFSTDGPNAGDQVPFPMGPGVRSRTGRSRSVSSDDNDKGITSNISNKEEISNTNTS